MKELQGSDAEDQRDEEEEHERARAKERATLAHRGQGKWHKNAVNINKYDKYICIKILRGLR